MEFIELNDKIVIKLNHLSVLVKWKVVKKNTNSDIFVSKWNKVQKRIGSSTLKGLHNTLIQKYHFFNHIFYCFYYTFHILSYSFYILYNSTFKFINSFNFISISFKLYQGKKIYWSNMGLFNKGFFLLFSFFIYFFIIIFP